MRLTVRRIFVEEKMPKCGITIDCVWRNWPGETIDGSPFAVKICDNNSPDGMDNGQVLKLSLNTKDGKQEIAAYERGWSIYPSGKNKACIDTLLAYCASLPDADNW